MRINLSRSNHPLHILRHCERVAKQSILANAQKMDCRASLAMTWRVLRLVGPSLATILFCVTAHAATIEKPLENPKQEQTARELFRELRCMVCEGQSLAESDAVLAIQMREHIRTLVASGETHDAILHEFERDYGQRILMNPPIETTTLLLWAAPFLLLLLGMVIITRATRKREGNDHD